AVLSGPAGGVLAVREVARRAGFTRAVGLDMGGTSTDVCRVDGDLPRRTGRIEVAGVHLARPMLAVDTIAAGGGSVLWSDGTRIGVGPRSAGAHPGPQCYGRGGPPTLTDAALELGLVDAAHFEPPLDPSCVDLPGDARSFVDVAREQMAGAVRRLALAEGADLADHALVAFGGAAGQHATDVARRLGIRTVLVHPCASVLSAWGQALAREERVLLRDLHVPLHAWEEVVAAVDALRVEAEDAVEVRVDLVIRHEGTDGSVRLPLATDPGAQEASFREAHVRRFGYPGRGPLEVCTVHLRALGPEPVVAPERWVEPQVRAVPGGRVLGFPTTSVWVPDGWKISQEAGILRLDDLGAPPVAPPLERTPGGVALWAARFMGVAEAGGAVLQRTARSVNVRERLDFSCAVFDRDGVLVANAPHIPVHLGAMGVTVRSLVVERDPRPGTHWLCNDPTAGGSHLPDLTVVSVGTVGGERVFTASRAHHVDVGGTTPGSMPPDSRELADEGVVFRHVRIGDDGSGVDLSGSRRPETVRADLVAQVAANRSMLEGLTALGPAVHAWMAHVLDATEELTSALVDRLPRHTGPVHDTLDGVPLALATRVEDGVMVVDLAGTGGPHAGNLNAPAAVVRAAVLYAVRVLLDTDLPLNEGVLRRVRILAPSASLVDPPPEAAVAGGNVETSMRIADLLLRSLGRCAASAGTMNNLTLGGDGWAFYETLGGGQGGTSRGPGASARQLHMTNTRATDAEVLEHRLPLRVRRFAIRRASGGPGEHPGGDGLIREIEVLAPCTAALLATRRDRGAAGLGGEDGAPGVDALFRAGRWVPWDGRPTSLEPGDRVRVITPGGGGYTRS
ncbi:MAG: hydantoinase B/oxoprolinase family protein, partial [Myxococcales bacterium]|nr:hydantoinase B/oxoprolinase family protein [Myxococcales bacterium]